MRTFLSALCICWSVTASARTIVVRPGQSIQAAVDRAHPGDRILVHAGTYHEAGRPCPIDAASTCAVVISKDDISVIGLEHGRRAVVLENAGGQDIGIAVAVEGAVGAQCLTDPAQRVRGVHLAGLTVNNFAVNGISLFCADDWSVVGCSANDNQFYGIFPSHCGNGLIRGSRATGANDTGIYVGQSHDVRVT